MSVPLADFELFGFLEGGTVAALLLLAGFLWRDHQESKKRGAI